MVTQKNEIIFMNHDRERASLILNDTKRPGTLVLGSVNFENINVYRGLESIDLKFVRGEMSSDSCLYTELQGFNGNNLFFMIYGQSPIIRFLDEMIAQDVAGLNNLGGERVLKGFYRPELIKKTKMLDAIYVYDIQDLNNSVSNDEVVSLIKPLRSEYDEEKLNSEKLGVEGHGELRDYFGEDLTKAINELRIEEKKDNGLEGFVGGNN